MQVETVEMTEMQESETDIAYKRAAKVFTVMAYLIVIAFFVGTSAEIGLLYMKHNLSMNSVIDTYWNKRAAFVLISYFIYMWVAKSLIAQSYKAVIAGRVLAVIMLLGVPVGTIAGIIALVRLSNKNL